MENREPDYIDNNGTKYWYDENGRYHNDNGYPAIIYTNGNKYWYKHGVQHNDFGPAIIWSDGDKRWYVDGIIYTEQEFKQYKIKQFIDNG